jgi:hypothetical protein
MKAILLLIFSIGVCSCSSLYEINERIFESQKSALLESPYKDASVVMPNLEPQRSYRLERLSTMSKVLKLTQHSRLDTIVIHEEFDAICNGCPSFLMQFYYRDTIYSFHQEVLGHRGGIVVSFSREPFCANFVSLDYEARNGDLVEVLNRLRTEPSWKSNPLQFGAESCLDGSHSLMTTILPDGEIQSLYVRCWLPESFRKKR